MENLNSNVEFNFYVLHILSGSTINLNQNNVQIRIFNNY